jgi:hypothetical protein
MLTHITLAVVASSGALPAASCDGAAPLAATVPPHEEGNWAVNDALALP